MNKTLVLDDLGFSKGETAVYLALFDLGETTVGPLSKKSGISHAKVYPILEKLIKKGLASYIIKNKTNYYSATAPESLLGFVDKKKEELEAEREKLQKLIPTLKAKKKESEKTQSSRIYEGLKGLYSLFEELFEGGVENEEILVFGFNESLERPDLRNFFVKYHDLRKSKGVNVRLMFNSSVKEIISGTYGHLYGKEDQIKYVDVIFPTSIFVFRDHVISVVVDEDSITSYDIKSAKNANRYVEFFESLWG